MFNTKVSFLDSDPESESESNVLPVQKKQKFDYNSVYSKIK